MRPITAEEYKEIIETMRTGGSGFAPNPRCAMALITEANLGIRIGDVLKLTLNDIVEERGGNYHLDIIEQKTQKKRTFRIPLPFYLALKNYSLENNIKPNEKIFAVSVRAVQIALKNVVDYLGLENISTHSFRKFFSLNAYEASDRDVVVVSALLQHTDARTTMRYLQLNEKKLDDTMDKIMNII